MTFNEETKQLSISPSDIGCFDYSPEQFYQQCVLKIRQPETWQMLWGSTMHSIIENGIEDIDFPFMPEWKQLLFSIKNDLTDYSHEVAMQQRFVVDGWEIILNYRLDAFNPVTSKVIELKFPQTAWTQYKANSDIKTLCYKAFHSDVEVWCSTWSEQNALMDKIEVKMTQEEAKEKLMIILKQIIGHLLNNYFFKS